MWRVLTKRNKEITMSFLPAGHTKFSPDWCFGLIKQRFRRTEVSSLNDIVNQSSYVNSAQLVGTLEAEILVKTFDWTGYLAAFFKKIPSIKQKHHLNINSNDGQIHLKETSTSNSTTINLLCSPDVIPPKETLPEQLHPKGLSVTAMVPLRQNSAVLC